MHTNLLLGLHNLARSAAAGFVNPHARIIIAHIWAIIILAMWEMEC